MKIASVGMTLLVGICLVVLAAGAGCAEDDDSSSDWAFLRATPTPGPGTWGALAYDQKHDICQEAGETMKQTADAVGQRMILDYAQGTPVDPEKLAESSLWLWPRAQSMFYDDCMRCGGPTEVIAHADEDGRLFVECATEGGLFPKAKSIPEGHHRIWP